MASRLMQPLFLVAIAHVASLPNGVGQLPSMGFNSWYALHNNLINYTWAKGYVLGEDVISVAEAFRSLGLQQLGYTRMNLDDCIVVGRNGTTHELIPDPAAFPFGVANVSSRLRTSGFEFGWYTVRGDTTCASGPPPRIERPGSHGYEALDAVWYAAQGISYLKDDTCGGPNVAYTVMRDALNGTGAHILYSMCEPGQGPVTAKTGRAVGNEWRVDEDDGGLWRPILDNVNMNAALWPYAGCDEQHGRDGLGCGWNDMGLLMVGGGMTYDQDVSHMALWSIMATKLLISVDVRKMTAAALSIVTNAEVIAIDQDPAKLQGQRVVPPVNASRAEEDARRIHAWKATHLPGGSWKAAGRSLELIDMSTHGPDVGAVPGTEEDDVLAAGGRPEVWQRQLIGGQWALLLFNNGMGAASNISCADACWSRMGWGAGQAVLVRDVFAHSDNGTAVGGFSAVVRTNATVMVRLRAV